MHVTRVAEKRPTDAERPKPLLRGWFHQFGSIAMLAVGPLIGLEAKGTKAELCAAVACFGLDGIATQTTTATPRSPP